MYVCMYVCVCVCFDVHSPVLLRQQEEYAVAAILVTKTPPVYLSKCVCMYMQVMYMYAFNNCVLESVYVCAIVLC
jgi:hypothetical protein